MDGQTAGPGRLHLEPTYGPGLLDWVYIQKTFFFPWFLVVLEIKLQGLEHKKFSTSELHPHRMQSSDIYLCSCVHSSFTHCARKAKQSNSHQQINKYKHMRWSSALERKEILTQATTWSTPVNTVLNETSHVQEDSITGGTES